MFRPHTRSLLGDTDMRLIVCVHSQLDNIHLCQLHILWNSMFFCIMIVCDNTSRYQESQPLYPRLVLHVLHCPMQRCTNLISSWYNPDTHPAPPPTRTLHFLIVLPNPLLPANGLWLVLLGPPPSWLCRSSSHPPRPLPVSLRERRQQAAVVDNGCCPAACRRPCVPTNQLRLFADGAGCGRRPWGDSGQCPPSVFL